MRDVPRQCLEGDVWRRFGLPLMIPRGLCFGLWHHRVQFFSIPYGLSEALETLPEASEDLTLAGSWFPLRGHADEQGFQLPFRGRRSLHEGRLEL